MTGPDAGPPPAGCYRSDFDHDSDVDVSDFSQVQRCIGGTGQAPPAGC